MLRKYHSHNSLNKINQNDQEDCAEEDYESLSMNEYEYHDRYF